MDISRYKISLAEMGKQLDLQNDILDIVSTRKDLKQIISNLKEKVNNNTFKILIMGQFSSGKSSMINAFLGEKILPTKVMPATAIITEIKYANEKKVIVFPKKNGNNNQEEPFEIPIDKIREYCLINHKQGSNNSKIGNVIDTSFEKMQVFWPLEMLKDGVEVIDSPGLNDPNSHDTITLEYLPSADAIIYCMNGTAPYSKVDVETLADINLRGYYTPIFVITRFDDIKEGAVEDVKEAIDTITKNLSQNTKLINKDYTCKLDGNGIFFVSSLDAIRAKRDNNMDELSSSGYLKMEKYLEKFLLKCKGDEKLSSIATLMKNVNDEAEKTIREHLNTADLSLEDFEKRIKNVNEKMDLAKKKSDIFVREFNLELDKALDSVRPIINSLTAEADSQLSIWQKEYVCSVSTEITQLKKTAQAITEEYSIYLKNRFDSYTLQWSNEVLLPKLGEQIRLIAERLEEKAKDISNIISDIKVELNFSYGSNKDELVTSTTRIVSVVYAFFTGDILTAIVGGVLGKEAMVRTLGLQFAAGMTLAIASCFTPIGLGAVIIGGLIATVAGAGWSLAKIKDTIIKRVTKKYRDLLSDDLQIKQINNKIFTQLNEKLKELRNNVKESALADINQIEIDIQNILEEKRKGEEKVEQRKISLNKASSDIRTINEDIQNIISGRSKVEV